TPSNHTIGNGVGFLYDTFPAKTFHDRDSMHLLLDFSQKHTTTIGKTMMLNDRIQNLNGLQSVLTRLMNISKLYLQLLHIPSFITSSKRLSPNSFQCHSSFSTWVICLEHVLSVSDPDTGGQNTILIGVLENEEIQRRDG
ncbi:hypothetical protein MKW98_025271, partial [Papaver atlanticum]